MKFNYAIALIIAIISTFSCTAMDKVTWSKSIAVTPENAHFTLGKFFPKSFAEEEMQALLKPLPVKSNRLCITFKLTSEQKKTLEQRKEKIKKTQEQKIQEMLLKQDEEIKTLKTKEQELLAAEKKIKEERIVLQNHVARAAKSHKSCQEKKPIPQPAKHLNYRGLQMAGKKFLMNEYKVRSHKQLSERLASLYEYERDNLLNHSIESDNININTQLLCGPVGPKWTYIFYHDSNDLTILGAPYTRKFGRVAIFRSYSSSSGEDTDSTEEEIRYELVSPKKGK